MPPSLRGTMSIDPGRRRGIITGGTWCIDRNKLVDLWPAEDSIAEILQEDSRGGGSGCNLAIDVKRLDPAFPVETIGLVGDDDDGRRLIAAADETGIERQQLTVTGAAATQYVDAYSSSRSGRRTHIFHQGAAALLTPEHFNFERTGARILHLGLPGVHRQMDSPWRGDPNGWVTVLVMARSAGLLTNLELCSLAAERIAALARPCLPHLDLLIVNDFEIGAIAAQNTVTGGRSDAAACIRAAEIALSAGSMRLVVVHFPAGAIAVSRDGSIVTRASVRVPAPQIVGANGAGDAFAAGFLYAYHEGWTVPDAIRLAHAAAATSLRGISTTETVETWQACLAFAESCGWGSAQSLAGQVPVQ